MLLVDAADQFFHRLFKLLSSIADAEGIPMHLLLLLIDPLLVLLLLLIRNSEHENYDESIVVGRCR